MDNERTCPSCGKQISSNASFCSYCGHKVEPVPPAEIICPNCGSKLNSSAKFCTNCGTKLTEDQQSAPQQPKEPKNAVEEPEQPKNEAKEPKQPEQNSAAPDQSEKKAYAYGQSGQNQQNQGGYSSQQQFAGKGEPRYVGFVEAIKLYFKNYVNFTGRASRSEFWWAVLFAVILGCVFSLLPRSPRIILSIIFFIPSLSITIRRLHDIGKKWPWIFIALIPIVGWIIMIVFCVRESEPDNDWGPVYREAE